MRLVSIALIVALCATCFAQENTWFYIENWSEAGCTGALQVTGIIADGACHANPPDGYVKATCTGGTPDFQTCTDNQCNTCTPSTPPTTCQSIEGGIYQKASCSDGTYPDGNNYILKHDYSELEGGNATCSGNPFRLTYLPLGCTTTAAFGAPSAFYECSAGTPSGQECTTTTCGGTCTDLTLAADCFVNPNGIASTHECSGSSGVTPSTPTSTPTSAPNTPTSTPQSTPTATPKAAPTGTPATTNAPKGSSATRFGLGFVLGAIVIAL